MSALKEFDSQFGASFNGAGTAVAGGAGNGTKVTGATIDLDGFRSGSILIPYTSALGDGDTLTFAVEAQESGDGQSWDAAVEIQAATIAATGGTGGTTEVGLVKIADDFEGRKRYVRFNITPDLSRINTDTLTWASATIRGGASDLPAI